MNVLLETCSQELNLSVTERVSVKGEGVGYQVIDASVRLIAAQWPQRLLALT
jgi:hypothetical protein